MIAEQSTGKHVRYFTQHKPSMQYNRKYKQPYTNIILFCSNGTDAKKSSV